MDLFKALSTGFGSNHEFISITGGGGKTSLMTGLSSYLRSTGKKVLMTTTTKIRSPYLMDYKATRIFSDDSVLSFFPEGPCSALYAFENEETGKYRARMVGSILCYFFLIYSVNRLLLRSGWKYILYGILGFIPIIMQGFRSMILLTVFSVFAMIPVVLRSGWKTIVYSVIGLGIALLAVNNSLVQYKIEEMSKRQERNQTFDNKDYIRWLSLDYFWNQQFTKPLEKFLGGGKPVDKGSNYAKRIDIVKKYYHFYWSDLGLVGFSMIVGMPAVFLLILMYVRCMWRCKDPSIQFVRFTLFIVLVGSLFVNSELYRRGNLLLLSLFLYLEHKYNQETRHSDQRKKYYTIKQIFEAIKKKQINENRNLNLS